MQLSHDRTYTIETGRYDGAYSVRWAGLTAPQASVLYRGLNVGNGYKKRLRTGQRVIARELTGGYIRPRHIRRSPLEGGY